MTYMTYMTDKNMKVVRYIRITVAMMMLLILGVGDVWALDASSITINVMPSRTEATSSVTATEGSVSASVSGRVVTLTVIPESNYYITTSDFLVDPLVGMERANAPKRGSVMDLSNEIEGTLYNDETAREATNVINSVSGTNTAYFVFELPSQYDGAYVTATFTSTTTGGTRITSSTASVTYDANGHYILIDDVSASVLENLFTGSQLSTAFAGTFEGEAKADGTFPKITGLTHALFSVIDGGTVKNIVLDNVSISGYTNITNNNNSKKATGAIANVAKGAARIYNCGIQATNSTIAEDEDGYTEITTYSSTVGESTSDYVGGLVGYLDGSARVINCYSFANITAGNKVGGIVGYNNVATKSNNLKTMVMNCMFYGDINTESTTNRAPIYNGTIITNRGDQSGVSNFNYFWAGATYVQSQKIDTYNCALAAETRYLQRFEFFRNMLNSNRALAAWWATDDYNKKDEMLKWVMEPNQIGSKTPYPILKAPLDSQDKVIKYPSVVNIDAENAEAFSNDEATKKTQYNQGRKFGTLSIRIQMGSGDGSNAPTGAVIVKTLVTSNITDKDPKHFNFNYYKVQLPYYNEVGTGNYTQNKVVTGWKIVSMNTPTGSFTTGSDATATVDANGDITLTTPYNFADRNSTAKDIYSSTNKRVFSQGAYFDVPEGVTSITIEPYWGKCVYVSDEYSDVVYNSDMTTAYNASNVGGGSRYTDDTAYDINGNSQKIYTSMSSAVTALNPSGTVYDNAIVLVGNVHSLSLSSIESNKPFTIMSIDLDKDNEPDYSYILRFNSRVRVHPVRIDFLNVIGLGMAQKSSGGTGTYNFGIMQPYGWFEVTNTGLFRVTQLEYDMSGRTESPIILQGGVIEQWVTYAQKGSEAQTVEYYHVGGNVWFKEFHIGQHQDRIEDNAYSPHPPISVTGGDFEEFYLTGLYNTPKNNCNDNAECYINGGRFGKVAGTGMQGIGHATNHTNGNIIWQIDNADIDEFYAGGINAAHIAQGDIFTVISNSRVDQFCGGPKFGDMNSNKKVVTNASNCTFRAFFGAGYGGNSYNRRYPKNQNNIINTDWNSWLQNGGEFEGEIFEGYKNEYIESYGGVGSRIDYQFLPMSDNKKNVARLFVDYVSFSLATTYDVTSKLTGCTITTRELGRLDLFNQCIGNFYGGGSLGKVAGNVKSTLTDCIVEGNVFGAGYSATLPTVNVMGNSFQKEPSYDQNLGAYLEATLPTTTTYTWKHATTVNSTETAIDTENHILYTTEDLTTLGAVTGNATLTINGSTVVKKSVYGGGEESGVDGNTMVTINDGTIGTDNEDLPVGVTAGATYGNVYGGGKGKAEGEDNDYKTVIAGLVKGNTKITINDGYILHNIYGGGAFGSVGNFTFNNTTGAILGYTSGGTAEVYIKGGTIGTDGRENGMVFGSSRGEVGAPDDIHDRLAWTYDTKVIVGDTTETSTTSTPLIKGSVYGGGENGHNYNSAYVRIHGGTIGINDDTNVTYQSPSYEGKGYNYPYRGNVYGGGCGTDKYDYDSDNNGSLDAQAYNPKAGIVLNNAKVYITGGHIIRNVYGAGAMGSVGNATLGAKHDDVKPEITIEQDSYGAYYDFGLSWPYELVYPTQGTQTYTGKTTINITGGTIGVDGDGNGDVYGAARGEAGDRFEMAAFANVRTTSVTIDTDEGNIIYGSVYGGGADGHVYEDANVVINRGDIRNSVFGGGAGEGTYITKLWVNDSNVEPGTVKTYSEGSDGEPVHSWTAGKVYGNTYVTIHDGTIGHNIYGGGNLASVGKGNYSGGTDDYSLAGYGELPPKDGSDEGELWSNTDFTGSGKTFVYVYGGTIGTGTSTDTENGAADGFPYGNVFGSSRGKAAVNCQLSPRYKYVPDFFLGYVNEATVVIGDNSKNTTPAIKGSVYGGGQDGHVRRSTSVTINKGTIGVASNGGKDRGNVFGAGSGMGKNSDDAYNTSSGSVTCTTTVTVNDNNNGTVIYQNVYGGGAQGSVGPPPGGITPIETNEENSLHKSYTKVIINGGQISGSVYGASRGNSTLPSAVYATDVWSTVNVNDGTIGGSVYGGGESGEVKAGVEVNIIGGTITNDVYGGGALAHTNSGNWNATENNWLNTTQKTALYTTDVNILGGTMRDVFGGGLGDGSHEPYVYGDILVNLNGIDADHYNSAIHGTLDQIGSSNPLGYKVATAGKGAIVNRVFGANNTNGSPKGGVTVHVYGTQHKSASMTQISDKYEPPYYDPKQGEDEGYKAYLQRLITVANGITTGITASVISEANTLLNTTLASVTEENLSDGQKNSITTAANNINNAIGDLYDVQAVYGGGNNANYTPDELADNQSTKVIIEGCDYSSIQNVYGGGNAAAVSATEVLILGTKIIDNVFGGGNGSAGADYAAHVGFYRTPSGKDEYTVGTGKTNVKLVAGTINTVFGGSNSNGDIRGGSNISMPSIDDYEADYNCCDNLSTQNIYGGGKNADMSGGTNIVLGCMPNQWIDEIYAGAQNADVEGDVSLTITSGKFERVFGGNKDGGLLKGSITVNIEETGGCDVPIIIGELYGGGNLADYSIYGYYQDGNEWKPRDKAKFESDRETALTGVDLDNDDEVETALKNAGLYGYPKTNPEVNVRAFTSIGAIYGGGYSAEMYADPHVDINVVKGSHSDDPTISGSNTPTLNLPYPSHETGKIGAIGNVFGGGNLATVYGSTTVNIGTESTVTFITEPKHLGNIGTTLGETGTDYIQRQDGLYETYAQGANITGDVFGGGNLADVTVSTQVNICAKKGNGDTYSSVAPGAEGVAVGGDVYGGGKGSEVNFTCDKAMVGVLDQGIGSTSVIIGNGTIGNGNTGGDVYGGGKIGRVEANTEVIIGLTTGATSEPVINGNVFGAGQGVTTHGYSGLTRGNSRAIIQGSAQINGSVFGGGEKASVGRYFLDGAGLPQALANQNSGFCYVTVQGDATVTGNVFGAGKGVVPYENTDANNPPGRMKPTNQMEYYNADNPDYADYTAAYYHYLQTLGIATQTNVIVDGNAKVNGSVYGGSENGFVQYHTDVTISGGEVGTSTANTGGNIYGGGKGLESFAEAGRLGGNAAVTISGGTTYGSVYGGGELGITKGSVNVNISNGTVTKDVYGGGQLANTNTGYGTDYIPVPGLIADLSSVVGLYEDNYNSTTDLTAVANKTYYQQNGNKYAVVSGLIAGTSPVTGYYEKDYIITSDTEAAENKTYYTKTHDTTVKLSGGTVSGDIYGGGLGQKNDVNEATSDVEAIVYGDVTVETTGGKAANVFGGNNLNGAPQRAIWVKINGTDAVSGIGAYAIGNVYGGGNLAAYTYTGSPLKVDMMAGTVNNIFGGGNLADVSGSIDFTVSGGTVVNDVYGGGALANTNTAYWNESGTAVVYVDVTEMLDEGSSLTNYYEKSGDEYISATGSFDKDKTYYERKNVTGGYWQEGKTSADASTTIKLIGGTVGNVYGGGLGDKASLGTGHTDVEAKVFGDVTITLGESNYSTNVTEFTSEIQETDLNDRPNTLKGRLFGANNLNGTPMGNINITVWRTIRYDNGVPIGKPVKNSGAFELEAVYGGGNEASYAPIADKGTHVYIHGCDYSSINSVYGGGNAASVPATDVVIYGSYEIGTVFGGGNGSERIQTAPDTWTDGNGADVIGLAKVSLKGGEIHDVFGGSNTLGTCGKTLINDKNTSDGDGCPLAITNMYGAGKSADAYQSEITITGCNINDGVQNIYAGSFNANIYGGITLNITGGIVEKVYGGNYQGGTIGGDIVINVEETDDCKPIIINSLFGGCDQANYPGTGAKTYNGTGDKNDESSYTAFNSGNITLNIKSCTYIGNIYGGSDHAEVKGNTEVNINMTKGRWAGKGVTYTATNYPSNISATPDGTFNEVTGLTVGGDNPSSVTGYYTRSGSEGSYVFTLTADETAQIGTTYYERHTHAIDNAIGIIGNVYGGGNEGKVSGNAVVNIGTETTVDFITEPTYLGSKGTGAETLETQGVAYITNANGTFKTKVLGANITGNVFGGGKLADVTGNTYVGISAKKGEAILDNQNNPTGEYSYSLVNLKASAGDKYEGVTIGGNLYGGGQGDNDNYECDKAMVGVNNSRHGSTYVYIGNGTIGTLENGTLKAGTGNIYGGGMVGRVEDNTNVTIGFGEGSSSSPTSAPVIMGDVFGAGEGKATHGYSGLVRGNSTVTVMGNTKVYGSVYGGGQKATVGRFWVKNINNIVEGELVGPVDTQNLPTGMPYAPMSGGNCTVTIGGYAEIGPDDMKMYDANATIHKPDNTGHVFGAGKGIVPYLDTDIKTEWNVGTEPGRWFNDTNDNNIYKWESYENNEDGYLQFIETLGLASNTEVTITGNAFIKGSVYGGSESGRVLNNTHVTIEEECQIGNGDGINERYTGWPTNTEDITTSWAECNHWDYDPTTNGAPYDPFATYCNPADNKYYYDAAYNDYAEGGSYIAKDGHTYYGNVFGGGSGVIPYKPGKWHRAAGVVGGNTTVDITGGHILTNVYGGNEHTDVEGNCTINMSGGTVGVPRTVEDMQAHPVTCYIFGAGKGDQRIFFNTWTNVDNTIVNITGGRIYGSVFGGGEDGHVIHDVIMTIKEENNATTIIGTTGTSYVDGNVFGGGRGFSGDAQTAGTVGGNVDVNIESGTMLGSVYGGGRLASVGTLFTTPENPNYGNFVEDDTIRTYGHVTVNISGGTIGNDLESHFYEIQIDTLGKTTAQIEYAKKELLMTKQSDDKIPNTVFELYDSVKTTGNNTSLTYKYRTLHTTGGNVYGGSMGRLNLLTGVRNPIWPKMAQVKTTVVNISGNAVIKSNVYGGGELGTVRDSALVNISAGTIRRDVYGGGYGSEDTLYTIFTVKEPNKPNPTTLSDYDDHTYAFKPMQFAGCVGIRTRVNITDGYIRKSVYGGGEMASVGIINCLVDSMPSVPDKDKIVVGQSNSQYYYYSYMTRHGDDATTFALSWPYEFNYMPGFDGETHIKITGGRIGLKTDGDIDDINTDNGDVYGGGKGIAGDYKNYIFCANVGTTDIYIDLPTIDPANYESSGNCISGAVYGGAENGHVMDSTKITLRNGLIGHALYGGGSGKGQFSTKLLKIGADKNSQKDADYYTRSIYSITAGKVFGNTRIDMSGGYVVRNVYGGGTLGSVGKGNYAGAKDDYSYYEASAMTYNGYGEALLDHLLWSNDNKFSQAFLSSGICTVNITGGTVGYIKDSHSTKDGLPYGNVFGGCRGASAPNITETPRYLYAPEAFLGYANETHVTIGTPGQSNDNAGQAGSAPRIYGSVYGGGQDGHVRRDATVTIYSGEIGSTFIADSLNEDMWLHSGNVYGAGSGIGKYKYDFDYDGEYTTTYPYNNGSYTVPTKEEDYSTSAGSVTRYTKVEIQGGIIHRNVYGGGSLASIGAPKFPIERTDGDPVSRNEVIISGGQIGDVESHHNSNHNYGGNVYGASRGQEGLGERYSSSVSTSVNISDTTSITGSVYGGGEIGAVKQGVDVNISGGTINHDVYGGGALASTNTSVDSTVIAGNKIYNYPTTTVNITGGRMHNIYGGGLGSLGIDEHDSIISVVEAFSGNVIVNLNSHYAEDATIKGAIVDSIYGANNLNGTPLGHIKVHVFATQNASKNTIGDKYPKRPVMGEKDHEDETQQAFLQRLIDSLTVSLTPVTYVDKVDSQVLTNAQSIHDKYTAALNSTSVTQAEKDSLLRVMNDSINAVQRQYARLYDVAVVFGGGNLAPYIPANVDSAEVIIDGCGVTSIRQVYGGGNAASVPSTYVVINGTYEIDEVFGGGNGNDPYELLGNTYENPGANVGYYNYTYFVKDNTTNTFKPVDKPNARTKEDRSQYYSYEKGSGIATTQIRGGKSHTVYGGSNQKGNIRTTALSVYDNAIDDCPIDVEETYGGGKNASMDGKIELSLDCIKQMDMLFGGAKNADVNNDIVLNVTNGTFKKVFGGNNTGGAVNGSITVNVEERGCQPIVIDELYGGGYLAPYSIYGYEKNATTGEYNYYQVDADNKFIKENGLYVPGDTTNGKVMPLDSIPTGSHIEPSKDLRINIISATRISNIYGGGYKAILVGSPHINVNMQDGTMDVKKKAISVINNDTVYQYIDINDSIYQRASLKTKIENGDTLFYTTIGLGTLGNIYGGGYLADVKGNTYIDIGTGEWLNDSLQREMIGYTSTIDTTTFTYLESANTWMYLSNNDTLYTSTRPTPIRNEAVITGDVFGGGDNADVAKNTYITIANGYLRHNIYGGGKMGSIGTFSDTIVHQPVSKPDSALYNYALSWPVQLVYKENTGDTHITITGGRIGTSGDGNGDIFGGGMGQVADRYEEAYIANVNNTYLTIDMPPLSDFGIDSLHKIVTAQELWDTDDKEFKYKLLIDATFNRKDNDTVNHGYYTYTDNIPCITGSIYGGAEDGHVIGNTRLELRNGIVGHALYGGGKGKGTYQDYLYDYTYYSKPDSLKDADGNGQTIIHKLKSEKEDIYSLTAGKVYGNTEIIMRNGYVMRNIFGGGNLGSIGIGNYAGGTDDYSKVGYGELPPKIDASTEGTIWHEGSPVLTTGITTVTIEAGQIGFILSKNSIIGNVTNKDSLIRKLAVKDDLPTGNVFGGCRGQAAPNGYVSPRYKYFPEFFLGYVNEANVTIGTGNGGPTILSSVYGGGQDGHVRHDAKVTIKNGSIGLPYNSDYIALFDSLMIKTASDTTQNTQWARRGNVFGAGSGIGKFDKKAAIPYNYSSGSVTGATAVRISGNAKIYQNVYGGGAIASVGPPALYGKENKVAEDTTGVNAYSYKSSANITNTTKSYTGTIVNIDGGIIGDGAGVQAGYGGDVIGASRGNSAWNLSTTTFATDFWSTVNVTGGTVMGNVFGGGETGMVRYDTDINISGGQIDRDVYGGGDMADVLGNTSVTLSAGWVKKSIYGGGNMGSVGDTVRTIKHEPAQKSDGALYNYALSWPVEFIYKDGTGTTNITVTGGRVGITGKDYMNAYSIDTTFTTTTAVGGGDSIIIASIDTLDAYGVKMTSKQFKDAREDNGDIYGGSKGITAERYTEAYIANVRNTVVNIDYKNSPINTSNISGYLTVKKDKVTINETESNAIHGSVYGGGENGHVYDSTNVTINNGLIGHGVYGGGKGKDTYAGQLIDYFKWIKDHVTQKYDTQVSSITAGKVYGNTNVTMNGGYVLRNIYGGGNLASVGKGNYAGGTDDYSLVGYGELPPKDNLGNETTIWHEGSPFMTSGITTVTINGGTVGYFESNNKKLDAFTKDDLPTGNVYGGSRGQAAPNYYISPRYEYFPEYFFGYVNEAHVTIGDADEVGGAGPRLFGSVYGGGQDGHVRRDATVIINKGEIGLAYEDFASVMGKDSIGQFRDRGNVYGAGSGIGQYELKKNTYEGSDSIEVGFNYSSGSVTGVTTVEINPGTTIHQNVYGGGSLASVGPPLTGPQNGQTFDEFNNDTIPYNRIDTLGMSFSQYSLHKSKTLTNVIINGGAIGDSIGVKAGYGGNVYGASRGNVKNLPLGDPSKFASVIWTNVEANQGHIYGNVFGGGEAGAVKQSTRVVLGGKVQPTNSSNNNSGGSGAPRRGAPAIQPNAAAPAGNVNSGTGDTGASAPANVATEAPDARSIRTTRVQ